jgi:ubiquinone/menaquinone biosynthesis C-methylase UbiE
MSGEAEFKRSSSSGKEAHQHKGKFTEGLLDSERILKALDIKAGQKILDAGCGNGYMSKLFSKEVAQSGKVYALDSNTHFIETLKKEVKGTNIETIEGDITKPTTLDASSIDFIYLSTVFHVFFQHQRQGFLQEIRRLLKPNAYLAIVEIEKKETPFGPPFNSRYSPEDLKKIVPLVPVNTVQVGEHFYMQIFQNMTG